MDATPMTFNKTGYIFMIDFSLIIFTKRYSLVFLKRFSADI